MAEQVEEHTTYNKEHLFFPSFPLLWILYRKESILKGLQGAGGKNFIQDMRNWRKKVVEVERETWEQTQERKTTWNHEWFFPSLLINASCQESILLHKPERGLLLHRNRRKVLVLPTVLAKVCSHLTSSYVSVHLLLFIYFSVSGFQGTGNVLCRILCH